MKPSRIKTGWIALATIAVLATGGEAAEIVPDFENMWEPQLLASATVSGVGRHVDDTLLVSAIGEPAPPDALRALQFGVDELDDVRQAPASTALFDEQWGSELYTDGVLEREMLLAEIAAMEEAERPKSSAKFFLVVALLGGIAFATHLGLPRALNQAAFRFVAWCKGVPVHSRHRHRGRSRSGGTRPARHATWYFRSRPSRRRRGRSHRGRRDYTRRNPWRPTGARPRYQRSGAHAREYVVSDVVFTTEGPVTTANQRPASSTLLLA